MADIPHRTRCNADLTGLLSEDSTVVYRPAAFSLPRVNHFVEHRLLYFVPTVTHNVAAAYCDLYRCVVGVQHQLAEPAPHTSRYAQ